MAALGGTRQPFVGLSLAAVRVNSPKDLALVPGNRTGRLKSI